MSGLDKERALAFLDRSRSAFLREAATWLRTFDDNADVLMLLSGDVGQQFGPWETFRFCALLGLGSSGAVQELALDVLAEPPSPRGVPLAAAFAVAHAKELTVDADAPYWDAFVERLREAASNDDSAAFGIACARLALQDAEARLDPNEILLPAFAPLSTLALEAALGRGHDDVAAAALNALATGQDDEGAAAAEARHPVLRGLVTLRALALQARFDAYATEPVALAWAR